MKLNDTIKLDTYKIVIPNGLIYHIPEFIPLQESKKLFIFLVRSLFWRKDSIQLFGKKIMQPRLTAWYGEPNLVYTYSGLELQTIPWTYTLLQIKNQIEATGIGNYNAVLINYYRNGNDSVGYHADDEPELGYCPIIAILSLGETRKLQMKPKKSKDSTLSFMLKNGDLFIMAGATQHFWYHQIPKEKTIKNPRISLTFRKIVAT
ncbi:MAG: alpha-ketoglutarate-dependent dioxygenase AlkB [Bacteroidia bacterium]|nr:alpha-ketoglutarate-dependent dioxygenase AlkB [Bacteroidia bacterium]MDW8159711.1 alpha-ketoglutarate-dependent dioxygenase AlkB [Bacteroidia bacterium]